MQYIRNLLNEQRRRATGSLMAYIEANVYQHLSATEQRELRSRVLGVLGQYHDICLDMLKASVNDGTLMNDDATRLLARLNTEVTGLKRALEARV